MDLKEKISQDFKDAFKRKDLAKKEVLSMMQSEIKNKEIELGKREEGLNSEELVAVISRAIKQRKDSVEQYKKGGREELAEKEQKEIDILEGYLPKQMDDAEIETEVKAAIEEIGVESKSDTGKVMGVVMGKLKGKADGTKVKEIVEKSLH